MASGEYRIGSYEPKNRIFAKTLRSYSLLPAGKSSKGLVSMLIEATAFDDVLLLTPKRFRDDRGWFMETWNRRAFAEAGIVTEFVQDNTSFSAQAGTVRGLHYQLPPFAQAKLVGVVSGRVLDVVVDVRRGSPSFGRHLAVELDSDSGTALYIPPGYAHGFCTLTPDVRFSYKVGAYYSPSHERVVNWCDPDLNILWPVSPQQGYLAPRDAAAPLLRDIEDLM